MPVYLPPLRGVSLSQAEAEAAAIASIGRAIVDCFEFSHPDWLDPLRIVNDKADLTGTLESDAPRNAGQAVLFKAIALSGVWPAESDSAASSKFQLQLDGVSAYIASQFDAISESLRPIEMIARRYATDDTSGPCRLPVLRMTFVDAEVTDTRVTGACIYSDPANRRFPARAYTREAYPGLSAR